MLTCALLTCALLTPCSDNVSLTFPVTLSSLPHAVLTPHWVVVDFSKRQLTNLLRMKLRSSVSRPNKAALAPRATVVLAHAKAAPLALLCSIAAGLSQLFKVKLWCC
jgi:hypothetical protein